MLVSAHCMMEWGGYRNWVQGTDTSTSSFQVWSVHKSPSWAIVSRSLHQTQTAQHYLVTFWKIHPKNILPVFIYCNWFFNIFLLGVCSEQVAELLPGVVSEVNCVSWIVIEPQVSLPGCVTQWPQRRRQHQPRQDSAMVIAVMFIYTYIFYDFMYAKMLQHFLKVLKKSDSVLWLAIWTYTGPSCYFQDPYTTISMQRHHSWWCARLWCVVPGTAARRGRTSHWCSRGIWYFSPCFLPWIPWALLY